MIHVYAHVGITPRHCFDPFIPVGHRYRDAVALGAAREMFFRPRPRELESELQYTIDAGAGEDGLLEDELTFGAREHATPDRRVFAFGVLAHDVEVDLPGLARLPIGLNQR